MGLIAVVSFLFIVFVLMLANRIWCSKERWGIPRIAFLKHLSLLLPASGSVQMLPHAQLPDPLWSLPLQPLFPNSPIFLPLFVSSPLWDQILPHPS